MFDTLDHRTLMRKIEKYGYRGKIHNLIENYSQNRLQCVCVNGFSTQQVPITTGVPQGSVLGPFLFLLNINYKPNVWKNSSIAMFADGTTLITPRKRIDNMLIVDIDHTSK